jgi:DnaD/phage-associated family protein
MNFEKVESVIYSDTPVPDVFLLEYLPSMKSEYVKIYVYSLFLCKHRKKITASELSKKLGFKQSVINDAFLYLESIGALRRKDGKVVLEDLKQAEVNKIYRLKTTSTPEEVAENSERNKRRNQTIAAINNTFFQGVMSPSWYTDIDSWFDKYGFEEDVMYALFQHCYDHRALSKSYIVKVAENWHSKNIKNSFDLDAYFIKYQKCKEIKSVIIKKLKLGRNLTEYEEEFVEKWCLEYGYGLDIVEIALQKTTAKPYPSFKYLNGIIASWHREGLTTKEQIMAYENSSVKKQPAVRTDSRENPHIKNFEQRAYGNEFYDGFFDNPDGEGNKDGSK